MELEHRYQILSILWSKYASPLCFDHRCTAVDLATWCHHKKYFIKTYLTTFFFTKAKHIKFRDTWRILQETFCALKVFSKTILKRLSWGYLCTWFKDGLYSQRHPFLSRTIWVKFSLGHVILFTCLLHKMEHLLE